MAEFDPNKPSIARVYDYLLGGKDNFAADREVAEKLIAAAPVVPLVVRENKDLVTRAVRWAAEQGVSQFIDLGCGLPTEPSTQQTAREVLPDARIAYVDNDPVVISHLNALLHKDNTALVVNRDVNDVQAVLGDVARLIDLSRPVCLLLCALLHFYDRRAASDLAAGYIAALAPGSYAFLTAACATPSPEADQLVKVYANTGTVYFHSAEEFASFFGDLELVPPGVTDGRTWRPGWETVPAPAPRGLWMHGAIGRVPSP